MPNELADDVADALDEAGLEVRFLELALAVARSSPDIVWVQETDDPLSLRALVTDHDEPSLVNLNALFRRTRQLSPGEKGKQLESFFLTIVEPPEVPEDWVQMVVPDGKEDAFGRRVVATEPPRLIGIPDTRGHLDDEPDAHRFPKFNRRFHPALQDDS